MGWQMRRFKESTGRRIVIMGVCFFQLQLKGVFSNLGEMKLDFSNR